MTKHGARGYEEGDWASAHTGHLMAELGMTQGNRYHSMGKDGAVLTAPRGRELHPQNAVSEKGD